MPVTQALTENFGSDYFTKDNLYQAVKEIKEPKQKNHSEILDNLLNEVKKVNFALIAFPELKQLEAEINSILENEKRTKEDSEKMKRQQNKVDRMKLKTNHYLILTVENILKLAKSNKWDLGKKDAYTYIYNGAFWKTIETDILKRFLGEVAEKMGVEKYESRFYEFRDKLIKQFLTTAFIPIPDFDSNNVCINLLNGTFEVNMLGTKLRNHDAKDFLTYQLPFDYDPTAKAPIFQKYLDRVLPDKQKQMILSEFLGYVFTKHGNKSFKFEKTLILYGGGANGKSVFFEVVNALLGNDNFSSYSLQNLTDENGYYRAMIANKLVNYATEINGKLETSIFKALVSGEPVGARVPYYPPFTLNQYAKLIFNCNELPKDVEHSTAFFRRFLIVPFDVTIPENEQDKQLHTKIIENELSGVFNWVLDGLNRLFKNKNFTNCEAVNEAREQYKLQSDTVGLFINERGYVKSLTNKLLIKDIYSEYRNFCNDDGNYPVNKMNFRNRLENNGINTERNRDGNIAYLIQN